MTFFPAELSQIPLSPALAATLAHASDAAASAGSADVTLEHVLAALCDDADALGVFDASHINVERLRADVTEHLLAQEPSAPDGGGMLTVAPDVKRILEAAAAAARGGRRRDINGAIVLAAIIGDERSVAAQILQAQGLTFDGAIRALQSALAQPSPREVRTEVVPAEDVLARARERVQSRAAPSLRQMRGEQPAAAPVSLPAPPLPPSSERYPPGTSPASDAPSPAPMQPDAVSPQSDTEDEEDIVEAKAQSAETVDDATAENIPASQPPPPEPKSTLEPKSEPGSKAEPESETVEPEVGQDAAEAFPASSQAEPNHPPPPVSLPPPQAAPPLAEGAPFPAPPFERPPSPSPQPRQQQPSPDARAVPTAGPHGEPIRPVPPPPASLPHPATPQGFPPFDLGLERPRPGPILPPPIPAHQLPGQQRPGFPQGGPSGAPRGAPHPMSVPIPGPPPSEPQRQLQPRLALPDADVRPGAGAPAAGPAKSAARQGSASRKSRRATLEPGQIAENIPRKMRVGRSERIEIRIAKASVKSLTEGLEGGGTAWRHSITVTKAMSVRLRAPEGGFFIETASPETQWIENQPGLGDDDFASWRFLVTPRARGWSRLQIIISARTVGTDGVAAETALPDQVIEIKVRANIKRVLLRLIGWSIAAVAGGALARFGEGGLTLMEAYVQQLLR